MPFKFLKNSSGMTLLEILIAIVLLSFLMIGVYSIIDNSSITKERVTVEDREFLQVEAAFNRFAADFSVIYSPLYFTYEYSNPNADKSVYDEEDNNYQLNATDTFEPTEKFPKLSEKGIPIPAIDNEKESILGFLTASNKRKIQNTKQSIYAWVRHSLRSSENEERREDAPYEWVRQIYADNLYTPEHNWNDVKAYVLLNNVKKLEFSFWDQKKEKYLSSIKELTEGKYLIRAVKVMIEWVDPNGVERAIERTFTPMWPFFDTIKEKKLLDKLKKQTNFKPGPTSGAKPDDNDD